jgi:hypothetical protein
MPRRAQRGAEQKEGVLAGHFKKGRVFRPPLLAYPEFTGSDWVRDDLPDLLWPAVVAFLYGDDVVALFAELQSRVLSCVGVAAFDHGWEFDGRLTSLEAMHPDERVAVIEQARSMPDRSRLFPRELVAIAAMYAGFPGTWLVSEPWAVPEPVEPDVAATVLARTLATAVQETNALVKAPVIRWGLATGRMTLAQPLHEEIVRYPGDAERRAATEAVIRSTFLATKALVAEHEPERPNERDAWASAFWSQNWHATPCWPEEEVETESDDPSPRADDETTSNTTSGPPSAGPRGSQPEKQPEPNDANPVDTDVNSDALARAAVQRTVDLFDGFLEAVLNPALPVDLRRPERHEVLTGLVSRAARAVIRTLHHPDLWSGEHGMATMRILAETKIVVRWMGASDDPEIYAKYQDYGHGKRKLMRLHLENVRAEFDEPPAFLNDASTSLERATGGDWGEQFQAVSVERTFANKDLRQMAAEVGLEDLYRYVFQPASGISHGEWWAVEDYAMQRCLNPLHRFHLIPSFCLEYPTTTEFPRLLESHLHDVMSGAIKLLTPVRSGSAGAEDGAVHTDAASDP